MNGLVVKKFGNCVKMKSGSTKETREAIKQLFYKSYLGDTNFFLALRT